MKIGFGVPRDQSISATEILYDAFEKKFKPIFGSRERTIALMAGHLRYDRTIAASCEGRVVGIAGLKFDGKEFLDFSLWSLLRELKLGIFRLFFLGVIFFNIVKKDELLVDSLAVTEDMRGKGIGKELMEFVVDFARKKGYRQVKLHVIDSNEKAKRFYERLGFSVIKFISISPWNRIFGFEGVYEMTYSI